MKILERQGIVLIIIVDIGKYSLPDSFLELSF